MAQMSFTNLSQPGTNWQLLLTRAAEVLWDPSWVPVSSHFSWISFLGSVKGSRSLPKRPLRISGKAGKLLTPMSQGSLRTAQGSTKSLRHCPQVAIQTFYLCVYTHEDGRWQQTGGDIFTVREAPVSLQWLVRQQKWTNFHLRWLKHRTNTSAQT